MIELVESLIKAVQLTQGVDVDAYEEALEDQRLETQRIEWEQTLDDGDTYDE